MTGIFAEYIERNDIEGAYKKFETARRWKSNWWQVVETIFNSSVKWARRYIIDPINRTLRRLTTGRGRPKNFFLDEVLTFNCEAEGCGAYVVQHFDKNGKILWTKPGKADDAQRRLAQHFQSDYKGVAETGVLLAWYPCKNSNHALTVENILRDAFERKGHKVMGQDRFPTLAEITAEDWAEINRKVAIVENIF